MQSPPPRGRPSLHCFARQYLLQWFGFPICHTHVLALLSHCFKSVTCVCSVIFTLQRWCTGFRAPFSDPRCVLPYGTTHAHLVHMCWPLLWGLRQMGRSFATLGTYALVGHNGLKMAKTSVLERPIKWPNLETLEIAPRIGFGVHMRKRVMPTPPPPSGGIGKPSMDSECASGCTWSTARAAARLRDS